ncbi:hypothetical protein SAMN05443254_105144 [Bradyrhizobium sp. OK095]|nr:hypothetical protein SAMN05443254_105144 [Bradyrhizobium sp. OK095]
MRAAWTPHAQSASPLRGEAFVPGSTGAGSVEIGPVTINQFPAVMLNDTVLPSADQRKAAYMVAWRRCFAPT